MHRFLPCLVLVFALATPVTGVAGTTAPATGSAVLPASPVLPWIADDWPTAVRVAKARKVPIFVENWAPW
jgi:hypothetical protein